ELREVIRKLPVEAAEVAILHYLQGYDCREIAAIIGATVSTVKYRLSAARAHLRRELGEGDLVYLNEPLALMRQWNWLPLDQMHALETRLAKGGVGGWALGVGTEGRAPNAQRPTPNAGSEAITEETMERR